MDPSFRRTSWEAAILLFVLTQSRQEAGTHQMSGGHFRKEDKWSGLLLQNPRTHHTSGHGGAHLYPQHQKVEDQEASVIPGYVTNPRPTQHDVVSCFNTVETGTKPLTMQKTDTRGSKKILQSPEKGTWQVCLIEKLKPQRSYIFLNQGFRAPLPPVSSWV